MSPGPQPHEDLLLPLQPESFQGRYTLPTFHSLHWPQEPPSQPHKMALWAGSLCIILHVCCSQKKTWKDGFPPSTQWVQGLNSGFLAWLPALSSTAMNLTADLLLSILSAKSDRCLRSQNLFFQIYFVCTSVCLHVCLGTTYSQCPQWSESHQALWNWNPGRGVMS